MANIRKRGDKWQVQVRRLGFPNRSRSFNRHEEVKAWARAQELAMGRLEAGVRYIPHCSSLSPYQNLAVPERLERPTF